MVIDGNDSKYTIKLDLLKTEFPIGLKIPFNLPIAFTHFSWVQCMY